MRVILLEDVKKQGKKGDVLTVKDGYGTYLVNNNLAVKETKGSINVLNNQKKQAAMLEDKLVKEANELKNKIEKLKLTFKVKTGKADQVFGSISTKQIASKLEEQGIKVDKKKIVIDTTINTLGITNVKINLHKKINATLKVELQK